MGTASCIPLFTLPVLYLLFLQINIPSEQRPTFTNMRMPWALSRSLLLVEFTNIPSWSRKLLWLGCLLCRTPILLLHPTPYVSLQHVKQVHIHWLSIEETDKGLLCSSRGSFFMNHTYRGFFSLIVLTPCRSERGVLGRFLAIPVAADQQQC